MFKKLNLRLKSWKHRHYGEHMVIVMLLAGSLSLWIDMPSLMAVVVNEIRVLGLFAALYIHFSHLRGELCESCIDSMPLDPEAVVKKRMGALRWHHFLTASRARLYGLLVVLLLMAGAGYLPGVTTTGQNLIGNLSTLLVISMFVSSGIHRRLYPWCPWCRNDGHGDDEREEVPDPSEPVTV